jgi:hypothetical protein
MSKANDERRARMAKAVKEAERTLKALEETIASKGENAVHPFQLRGARRRLGAKRSALSRFENSIRGRG